MKGNQISAPMVSRKRATPARELPLLGLKRVQAASRGWPVLGDAQYGSRLAFGAQDEDSRKRAIALHARSLTFLHPIRYEPITLIADLPRGWRGRFAYLLRENPV